MALSFTTALKNARADAISSQVGSNGKIRIYAGTVPADANAALSSNTLLAELACSATFAAAASGGVLTVNTITQDTSADATGTATFFRVLKSDNTVILQGAVGTSGSELNLNTTSISAGAAVSITAFTLTEAN
jgi:hypothetical protein